MIRKKDVRRMAAILCVMTGMSGIPAYAAVPETLGAKPGWNQISGNWYYLMGNGAWSTDFIEDENTCYTFTKDGIFSYARKNPNTRGGAYPVDMLDQKEQELFDEMNDEKSDLFFDAYPDAEDDYDNGDVEFYDGQASFVLDQTLNRRETALARNGERIFEEQEYDPGRGNGERLHKERTSGEKECDIF